MSDIKKYIDSAGDGIPEDVTSPNAQDNISEFVRELVKDPKLMMLAICLLAGIKEGDGSDRKKED